MPASSPSPEPLEQVHELNRLFLRSLQVREKQALIDCGYPPGAIAALRRASDEQLDAVAVFPRALFDLILTDPVPERGQGADAASQRILELTVAYCAWSTSRESTYHAKLFLGLAADVIHALRTTPLSLLPRLALTRARVVCAFSEAEFLWRQLLVETRPEARRRLVLVALQPPLKASGAFGHVAERARTS